MKNKRILSAAVASCFLVLALTACSGEQSTQTPSSNQNLPSASSSLPSSTASKDDTPSASKKLTGKCNDIKLGDKKLEVPFTLKDLGDGYSISSKDIEYTENLDGSFDAKFTILHDGTAILTGWAKNVESNTKKESTDLSDKEITDLEQIYVPENGEVLSLGGVAVGDKPENIPKKMGEADKTTACSYIYYNNGDESNGCFYVFDDFKGVYCIRWFSGK